MTSRGARLRPWHVPAVLSAFLASNAPSHDVVPFRGRMAPAITAALATLPTVRPDHRPVGAWVDARLEGFGLVRVGAGHRRSSVVALTVAGRHDEHGDGLAVPAEPEFNVCRELLGALTTQAAAQGRVSLVARLPDRSPFAAAFEQSGFAVAVRERIYRRQPAPAAVSADMEGLRPQEPADAWDVQQLYRAITPAAVQQAASLGEHAWDLPGTVRRRLIRTPQAARYVVVGAQGLDAWLEVRSVPGGPHEIALMLHPRAAQLAVPAVQFALWKLSDAPRHPVEIVAREHDVQTPSGLAATGFEEVSCRLVMAKHMAVRVTSEVPDVALDRATS